MKGKSMMSSLIKVQETLLMPTLHPEHQWLSSITLDIFIHQARTKECKVLKQILAIKKFSKHFNQPNQMIKKCFHLEQKLMLQ
jgi:AMMECR1 domain-containing protein